MTASEDFQGPGHAIPMAPPQMEQRATQAQREGPSQDDNGFDEEEEPFASTYPLPEARVSPPWGRQANSARGSSLSKEMPAMAAPMMDDTVPQPHGTGNPHNLQPFPPPPQVRYASPARYISPMRYISPARQASQNPFPATEPVSHSLLPPSVSAPLSPRWGAPTEVPLVPGLPSADQVIAATKAVVPPISSICARLASPLHLPPPAGSAAPHDVLKVTVQTARDLLDNRGRIQGDFYVKLRLGTTHQYESETVHEVFNPAWYESFCFDMQTEDGDGMLEIVVLDRHNSPDDYVVGVAFLDLYALHPALVERGTVEVVLGLTNQGVHVGSVDIVIAPVHRSQLERPSTQQALHMPSPQLMFEVTPDYSDQSDENDSNCVVPAHVIVNAPVVASLGRTNVVRLTLLHFEMPRSDEPPKSSPPSIRLSLGSRHHRFELTGKGPFGTFMIDLYERPWDDAVQVTAMEKHAVCGQGRLPLSMLRELPFNQTLDCRVPLIWMSSPAGALILQAERLPTGSRCGKCSKESKADTRALTMPMPHSTPVAWCGTIRVTVGDADITTRKAVRSLDPYIRLKFGKTSCDTSVRYGTTNPVAFRESFDLYHPVGAGSVLEVHLMDKKPIGADEPLGRGFVDLIDFLGDPNAKTIDFEVQLAKQGNRQGCVNLCLIKVAEKLGSGSRLNPQGRERVQVTVYEAHRLQWSSMGAGHCHLRLQIGHVEHHTSTKLFSQVISWREGFLFENVRRSDALVLTAIVGDERRSDVIGSGSVDVAAVLETHDGEPVKVPLSFQKRPAGVLIITIALPREPKGMSPAEMYMNDSYAWDYQRPSNRLPKRITAPLPPRPSPAKPAMITASPHRRLSATSEQTQSGSRSTASSYAQLDPWDIESSEPEPVPSIVPPLPLNQLTKRDATMNDDSDSHDGNRIPTRLPPRISPGPSRRFSETQPTSRSSSPHHQYYEHGDHQPPQPNPEQQPLYGPFVPAGRALASPRRIAGGATRFGALSHSHHVYSQ